MDETLERKLILAEIRQGDFAHAGGEEAIEICLEHLNIKSPCRFLDVGCGLGGTVNHIAKKGMGLGVGIDIKKEALDYARKTYPELSFYDCSADNLSSLCLSKFDLIYMMNAYFCFKNQALCLKNCYENANEQATLLIYDYASQESHHSKNPFAINSSLPFNPINLKTIDFDLQQNGWKACEHIDVSDLYIKWYRELIDRLTNNRKQLITKYREKTYDLMTKGYVDLLPLLDSKKIFGSIIIATRL